MSRAPPPLIASGGGGGGGGVRQGWCPHLGLQTGAASMLYCKAQQFQKKKHQLTKSTFDIDCLNVLWFALTHTLYPPPPLPPSPPSPRTDCRSYKRHGTGHRMCYTATRGAYKG